MEAENQIDNYEKLRKNFWHPTNKAASVTELDEDMRNINDDLDQAEHQLDNDRAYRNCHDDNKKKVQHNDHKELMEESLQPSKKFMNKAILARI